MRYHRAMILDFARRALRLLLKLAMWLLVLVAAWLAGRLAATLGGGLPAPWLAVIDLAFPVLLAVFAGREIVGGGSRRNYGIAAITWVLPALVLLYHLGEAGIIPGADRL